MDITSLQNGLTTVPLKNGRLASHNHARRIMEQLPIALLWLDKRGKVIDANKTYTNLVGYTREELLNLYVFDINPFLTSRKFKEHWKYMRNGNTLALPSLHQTKSEDIFPSFVKGYYFEENGKEFCCCHIENQLETDRYKDLLKAALQTTNTVTWEWDDIDKKFICSKSFQEMFELDKEVSNGYKSVFRFVRKKLSRRQMFLLKVHLKEVVQERKPNTTSFHIKSINKWMQMTSYPVVVDDRCVKVYSVLQDISSRKEHENQLEFFQYMVDTIKDMVMLWSREGDLVYCNQAVCNNLGYTKEEMKNIRLEDFLIGFKRSKWKPHWDKLQKDKSIRRESVHRAKDGSTYPVEVVINYIKFDGKEYNCGFVRNITERKEKEDRLEEALALNEELREQLKAEVIYLKEEIKSDHDFDHIITKSPKYRKVLNQVRQVAKTDATVLILGETGTGKELLARAVHSVSLRQERPLIKINCAALPPNLIESELFGHERGAFTGAYSKKVGRFELANNGTIFLDEIGELPLDLQAKLLRVLQEGEFERVGGTKTLKVDVRIIAATNRDLKALIGKGTFREDLYYRLNVFPIVNPPLRERKDDVEVLVPYFMKKYSEKTGKHFKNIAQSLLESLRNYDFPGNIRELENIIERAVILSKGRTLMLPYGMLPKGSRNNNGQEDRFKTFEEIQKEHILAALARTNWRVSGPYGAAKLLGLKAKTLESKMKKLEIRRQDYIML